MARPIGIGKLFLDPRHLEAQSMSAASLARIYLAYQE